MWRALAALAMVVSVSCASAQPVSAPSVNVRGLSGQAISITASDLAAGRTNVRAELHGQAHTFEGVALTTLLARVGAPSGQNVRGDALRTVVLVSARDGYRVVFTLTELDPAFGAKKVILADRMDGAALPAEDGPFRIVVDGDRRGARSARQVERIELRRVD